MPQRSMRDATPARMQGRPRRARAARRTHRPVGFPRPPRSSIPPSPQTPSGQTKLAVNDRDRLASDADDFRPSVFRLDADLDAARVMNLNPLLDHEGRSGELLVSRKVR